MLIKDELVESREEMSSEPVGSTARLAPLGALIVDPSPPRAPHVWNQEPQIELQRRGNTVSSSPTLAPSSTLNGIAVPTTSASQTLPTPLDSGYSSNVTSGCADFVNGFLANSTFQSCLPVSLLLQYSQSFFNAEKSFVRITQVLDYTCAANVSKCAPIMKQLAASIGDKSKCAYDLSQSNPTIQFAQLALEAYVPIYSATCLKDPSTSSYCFADVITNSTNPTDPYVYYLPLNMSLPGGSEPTCSTCLKNTLAVFQAATSDRSSVLAGVFPAAAQVINVACGPAFVNTSLAASVSAAVSPYGSVLGNTGLTAIVLLVASWLL